MSERGNLREGEEFNKGDEGEQGEAGLEGDRGEAVDYSMSEGADAGRDIGRDIDKKAVNVEKDKVEKDKVEKGVDKSSNGLGADDDIEGVENNILDKEHLTVEARYNKLKDENPYMVRIGLWFGSIASLLSLMIGFISGIELWTVVIRSLLVFMFFFIFGVVVYLLLKSLIPEIFELGDGVRGGGSSMLLDEGEDLGGSIDYTIDEGSEDFEGGGKSEEDFKIREGKGLDISSGSKREDMLIPDNPELLAKAVKTAMND